MPVLKVTHLKAHGALNNMAAEDEGYALAIGRAIKAVDRNIIYVALSGSQMEKAAPKLELPTGARGLSRSQVRRRRQPRLAHDSRHRASRTRRSRRESALRMVQDGEVVS